MPMQLSNTGGQYAISKSTFAVTVAFFDENNTAVTPTSAKWTLTDGLGVVVNGRTAQAISVLSTAVTIVLDAGDIDYTTSASKRRVLTVTALYNSTLGSNLPDVDSISFPIADTLTGNIGV